MAEASLRKFRPIASTPWDYAKAAHLLSRAGFRGPPDEIQRLVSLGFDAAVDELLNYERAPDLPGEVDFSELRQAYVDAFALRQGGVDEPDGGDEAAAAGENGSLLARAARLRLPGRAESRVPLPPEPPLPPHGPGQLQTADPGDQQRPGHAHLPGQQ